jgi:hypothetical protein
MPMLAKAATKPTASCQRVIHTLEHPPQEITA